MKNKDFYKRVGFLFAGIILVLVVARHTLFLPKEKIVLARKNGQSESTISWRDAGRHVGEYLAVEGKVVRTYNSGRACFLNFHPDYKRYFSAVIFYSDFNRFPYAPEKHYKNREVRVVGVIEEYNGAPQIILNSPSQIKLLDDEK